MCQGCEWRGRVCRSRSCTKTAKLKLGVGESVAYQPLLSRAMDGQTDSQEDCDCNAHPSVLFLLGTLLLTSCSTAMLCAAIMTDHWEHVTWSRGVLDVLANGSNARLEWYLDGIVARVVDVDYDERFRKDGTFLVPMNGGIWTLCVTLTDAEIHLLSRVGFPKAHSCVNYLAGGLEGARGEEPRSDWQHRMQNLSISCALVCLIVLGSAALVGAFGVCKHQISAVLVTGVMYLLAALFALFTLMIIHFKRHQSKPRPDSGNDGTIDGVVGGPLSLGAVQEYLGARVFSTAWSLDLGWGGVVLCALTSFFWILLSKIMRFNPLSAILI